MRWLMAALLVSLVALLIAAAGAAWHIRREHRRRTAQASTSRRGETDTEEAP
jgi:Flp pilus assembly protein TadB